MSDPYAPPSSRADLLPTREHPSYPLVLRMVLWGEEREQVFARMAANGIRGEAAERLHGIARAERIRMLRRDASRDVGVGVAWIAGATGIFCGCWFGLGVIPRIVLLGCFGATGFGLWKLIDGLGSWAMAGHREGPVDGA